MEIVKPSNQALCEPKTALKWSILKNDSIHTQRSAIEMGSSSYLTSKPTSSVYLKKNNGPCFEWGEDLHRIYNSRLTGNYTISH